ncbi:MAG: 1,4-alpha-glucan branching protein GlgB [Halothiobacillaceae bacterium]
MNVMDLNRLDPALAMIVEARHHDPFEVLGRHPQADGQCLLRTYQPTAAQVFLHDNHGERVPLAQESAEGLFQTLLPADRIPMHPKLEIETHEGGRFEIIDPYSFAPTLGELDLYLFGEGKHQEAWRMLGAHAMTIDGVDGVRFAVWAPNATRVSVVGDFNQWDGRRHPMRVRGGSGVWELFIPGLADGEFYKFELRNRDTGNILVKSDPYGRAWELRPGTATRIATREEHVWQDGQWLEQRRNWDWLHAPMSVYEVHLGSWQTTEDGEFLGYREIAHRLVDYVRAQGFTHIELLPITEHPFDASWGYQTTGYFAPTARFGTPDDFRYFVDYCHQHGIGVILDWVPAHFPRDSFALANFDGTALYEHQDPRRGEHRDWGTLIFNYGRNEVRNFLVASALYWVEQMHIDGLRVDAVASMLYLDYSREEGDWVPNMHGGRENLEAIHFIEELNHLVQSRNPGALVIAEESTAWPQVTRPPDQGGLGFALKWNMGWMNDTLRYMGHESIHRAYHHNDLTFGLLYSFTENFMLPFSHDEVVHGKQSLLGRMPGDEWQRFANLRLLLAYQFLYPGKKLLFMGCEFGQGTEWNHAKGLEWYRLDYPLHRGVQQMVSDLNHLYRGRSALHRFDFDGRGFEWVDCNDREHSIISFLRKDEDHHLICIFNFTPVRREGYRVGVPAEGRYRVVFNSDAEGYGGTNAGEPEVRTEAVSHVGRPHSVIMTLPPLGAVILEPVN